MSLWDPCSGRKLLGWLLGILPALALVGCTGTRQVAAPMTILLTPQVGQPLAQGSSLQLSAQVQNDKTYQGVSWNLSGDGALLLPTPYGVTYVAPSTTIQNSAVVVTATSIAHPEIKTYLPISLVPQGALSNVQAISVDGGPVSGKTYVNGAFTAVTVCAPGTTSCNTIDGILVDTGSTGLRIFSSLLPALPGATDGSGNSLSECVQFPDTSYLWGAVVLADVRIAGEVGGAVPIHAINALNAGSVPDSCSSAGTGVKLNAPASLGANGILGVGFKQTDCGPLCDPEAGGAPPAPFYYSCPGGTCAPTFVVLGQQVTNPVSAFGKDNNGLLVQLPGVDTPTSRVDGQLTFGIGTEANNQLANATTFDVDPDGFFTTNLAATGQSLTLSTVDTGSNSLRFPDDALTACGGASAAFYCPPASVSLASVQLGMNNAQGTVNFVVDNADTLFAQNPTSAVLPTLAGPNGSGTCSGTAGACQFQWGLPFFFGRIVYIAFEHGAPPGGSWFAYTTGFTKH